MRLEYFVDLEFCYESDVMVVRLYGSAAGTGYGIGTGVAIGLVLVGWVRWMNVAEFREDDVGLLWIDGVITTDDGVDVLVSLRGYAVLCDGVERVTMYVVIFVVADARYCRLNIFLAVVEVAIVDFDTMILGARIYECVHER